MRRQTRKKGFSLVELIVVLVIMAVLMAVLIPSMIGYIRQAREKNARNSANNCVQAAQTIVSSAYANAPNHVYTCGDCTITFGDDMTLTDAEETKFYAQVLSLAEEKGTVSDITLDENNKIATLTYVSAVNKTKVIYDGSDYTVA